MTEGLGPQRFQGRVVILVHEHTASFGRNACCFCPGERPRNHHWSADSWASTERERLQIRLWLHVGLPVAAYLGKGVSPSINVEMKPEQFLAGEDPQMQKALEHANFDIPGLKNLDSQRPSELLVFIVLSEM